MSFVQSAFLYGLGLLALPILLHLFSRRQTLKIELGTVRFLREILTENVHKHRIRRWFLLATRMLLMATLVFLFARPYLLERMRRDSNRHRVILVDRSASMTIRESEGRAIDSAIRKANEAARELGEDARIDRAWFDSEVHPLGEKQSFNEKVSLQGSTNFASAIAWARDQIASHGRASSDVVLVTDLQRRGVKEVEDLQFPPDVPIAIVDVGKDAASNLAITNLRVYTKETSAGKEAKSSLYIPAIQGPIRPDESIYISATLFNYGAIPRDDLPVFLTAKSESKVARIKTTINALPEQATELQLELGVLAPGLWEMTLQFDLEDDVLFDNVRSHAVRVDSAPKVVLIGDDLDAESESSEFFINKALRLGLERNKDRFSVTRSTSLGKLSALLAAEPFPAIVIADATRTSPSDIQLLQTLVERGSQVLAFAGEHGGLEGASQWASSVLAPGRFEQLKNAGIVPFRLNAASTNPEALAPFLDPQSGDLQRLTFRKVYQVRGYKGEEVLAWFDRDLPAIIEHPVGKGRILWFLSDAGNAWSDWTNSPLYLPLVHQLACDLSGLTGEGLIQLRTLDQSIRSEDGSSAIQTVGFHRTASKLMVVNHPEGESDTARLSEQDLRNAYQLQENTAETPKTKSEQASSIKQHEAWPWIAGLMFVLLVFEFGLSNRTAP